jgi:hypothetical protein
VYLLGGACSFEGEPDRRRAIADGRGDPFGRVGADVADRENPWPAGLEQRALGTGAPGADESVVVEADQAAEPRERSLQVGVSSDEAFVDIAPAPVLARLE